MKGLGWIAPALVTTGFFGSVVVFVLEQSSFKRAVIDLARRDLEARSALVAGSIGEMLDTIDFRELNDLGDSYARNDVRLTVFTGMGGIWFDRTPDGEEKESIYASAPCGDFIIRLGLPLDRVLAPFERAKTGFTISAVGGGAGVLLVFILFYRQSVHIRELAAIERFRRNFIADFSHELKTPLTAILGAVDLLRECPPGKCGVLMDMLGRESRRLDHLAQSILDLARLERGGAVLELSSVSAESLVADAIEGFAPAAKEKGVALSAVVPPGLPPVFCNRAMALQALSNLVGNALRHSGSPSVEVRAEAWRKTVRFVVEDRGCGIPHELREKVFERFYRVDGSRESATGGAGLGLSIVRRIARLHGGDVRLSGVEPHGCRFTVWFSRSLSFSPASLVFSR